MTMKELLKLATYLITRSGFIGFMMFLKSMIKSKYFQDDENI